MIDESTPENDDTLVEEDITEDNATEMETDDAGNLTDKGNSLTLDETGNWYWCYETQQWFQLTLDDSRNWFWSYGKQQWFPYSPPELNIHDGDDNTEEPERQAEAPFLIPDL